MAGKEKALREIGVQVNLCLLADVEVAREEEDGVTLLGRQGLTLRIGGEEGLYQEVVEGVKGEGAQKGEEYSQLGPPLPPRAEHKRKDLFTYLGLPSGAHSQGRKDIIRFLGMAQNVEQQDKRSDKRKEISRFWSLAQNMILLSNSEDSERRKMVGGLGRLHCFLGRTQSGASVSSSGEKQNGRGGEEETEKMYFPHKSADSDETRVTKVWSTFRDGWEEEEEEYPVKSFPIHNLNRNSVTASLSLSSNSFSSSSSPSSPSASSISSLSSGCTRPAASPPEEPIYMDMVRLQPPSTNFASPRRARISVPSSNCNDYVDMNKMSKVLNIIHK